jgi:tellurite resistance protein TerC
VPLAVAPAPGGPVESVGSPSLWAVTIGAVVALLALDFVLTRRPHEVSMREAVGWSAFYIALPLTFGGYLWARFGSTQGVEYLTGYVVEKSLSVDNLFVFMLLLSAFAVPAVLAQRVLLYGIVGALVLRGVFIALGAAALNTLDWAFLLFGAILVATAIKIMRDTVTGHGHKIEVSEMRTVRLLRRFMPVTGDYQGPRLLARVGPPDRAPSGGKGIALTPFALVVVAVLATDVVFAVDSVPAVYGVTGDPFLVFATNAFALLGLRALYFVLQGALARLVHLGYGLAAILGFIGLKLLLHWAHGIWTSVPQIPTPLSLAVIAAILATVTVTSLRATRGAPGMAPGTEGRTGETAEPEPARQP